MSEARSAPLAVFFSGGVTHDFEATSARLFTVLADDGWRTVVTETDADFVRWMPSADLLVFNTLRWTMRVPERYAAQAAARGFSPSGPMRDGVLAHLEQGRGILAMHTASICFDDWADWEALLGAAWDWDRSSHPPVGPISVRVCAHPLTHGLDDFETDDEAYSELRLADDVRPLLTTPNQGREQPLAWVREYAGGRVAHDALGHHLPSFDPPAHRELVRRLARWAGGLELPG